MGAQWQRPVDLPQLAAAQVDQRRRGRAAAEGQLALGPVRSGLLQVNPRIEETARSLGRGRFVAFAQTVMPLIGRNVAAGGALVLLAVMKELPMTYLLAPTGFRTLSVRVSGLTSEAMMAAAAPFALAIVLFSALFVGLLLAYEGRG